MKCSKCETPTWNIECKKCVVEGLILKGYTKEEAIKMWERYLK